MQEINLVTGVALSEITFTAANGDLLDATSIGTGTPAGPVTTFVGVSTITGGTGRFASATGVMDVTGTVNPAIGDASISANLIGPRPTAGREYELEMDIVGRGGRWC